MLQWGSSPSASGSALQLPPCCLVGSCTCTAVVSNTVKKKSNRFRQILQLNMFFKLFFSEGRRLLWSFFLWRESVWFSWGWLADLPLFYWRRVMVDPEQHKTSLNLLFIPPSYPSNSCFVCSWVAAYVFVCRQDTAGKQYHLWKCCMRDVFLFLSNPFSEKTSCSVSYIISDDYTQISGGFVVLGSAVILNTKLQYAGNLFVATCSRCGFLFPHLLSFLGSVTFAGGITSLCIC